MRRGDGDCGSVCESNGHAFFASILLKFSSIYNGIAVVGIAIFYFPESNLRGYGLSPSAILKKIDYAGAFLSISGLTLLYVSKFYTSES